VNCELFPRTAQLRLRTATLLYHWTAAAAAAAIAAASRVVYGLQILSMFSVAVELPCRCDAIILSLPCSSFELIPLNVATTQEHWGSDQVIFKDNKILCFWTIVSWYVTDWWQSCSLCHQHYSSIHVIKYFMHYLYCILLKKLTAMTKYMYYTKLQYFIYLFHWE